MVQRYTSKVKIIWPRPSASAFFLSSQACPGFLTLCWVCKCGLGVPSLPWQVVFADCNGSYVVVISQEGGIDMDNS